MLKTVIKFLWDKESQWAVTAGTASRRVQICYPKQRLEKKTNGHNDLYLYSALYFINDFDLVHFYLIFTTSLWVDSVDIILILQFRKLELRVSKMTFSMAVKFISVSFGNPVLFTLYPFPSSGQGTGPGRTVVLTGLHLRITCILESQLYKEQKQKQNKLTGLPRFHPQKFCFNSSVWALGIDVFFSW